MAFTVRFSKMPATQTTHSIIIQEQNHDYINSDKDPNGSTDRLICSNSVILTAYICLLSMIPDF